MTQVARLCQERATIFMWMFSNCFHNGAEVVEISVSIADKDSQIPYHGDLPLSPTDFVMRRPDDWHLHLRDGEMLKAVLPLTSADFARAIIMPNLVPPVVTTQDAIAYRDRIVAATPADHRFEPQMTLYLTEATDPADVEAGVKSGLIKALKLYPAGATTNSDSGVRKIEAIYPVLEKMSEIDVPMLVHGEVTDHDVDIFDREAVFIDRVLDPIRQRFPDFAYCDGAYHHVEWGRLCNECQ